MLHPNGLREKCAAATATATATLTTAIATAVPTTAATTDTRYPRELGDSRQKPAT